MNIKTLFENMRNFVEEMESEDWVIDEGGLKNPALTGDTKLDPATVSKAVKAYESAINMFSAWLQENGHAPVELVGPVGSTAYYQRDAESAPATEYGDVDYLINVPVEEEGRKAENAARTEYKNLLIQFLQSTPEVEKFVNVEATVKTSPWLLIVRLPSGEHAQVDSILSHPTYSKWTKSRWTPEHNIKGYTMGNLYTALGTYFNMSIGDRGVAFRYNPDTGERVSSRKTGSPLKTVSTDISTFLVDMAREIGASNVVELHPLLQQYPGVDPEDVSIRSLALGIKGLALTLEMAGQVDSKEMMNEILQRYATGLEKNVESKKNRGTSDEMVDKLKVLNKKTYEIARKAFQDG